MVGLTILAACGFALLSGCGASGNTNKLKSMAVRYVKEKYGSAGLRPYGKKAKPESSR